VESDTPEQAPTGHGTALGVDLGVNQLVATSTGVFWSGHEFDHGDGSTRSGVRHSSNAEATTPTRTYRQSDAKRPTGSA